MKTLVCQQPGVLQTAEAKDPEAKPGEVILHIRRIGICGTDLHAFEGTQPFFEYPRILGHELGASVAYAGSASAFSTGDHVTFLPYFNCGTCIACTRGLSNCCSHLKVFGVHIDGGMRKYVSVPEQYLVKANDLDMEMLALVEPLAIGAHGIQRAAIQPGDQVLVVGAGPIGLGLALFAGLAGGEVIVADTNEQRLDFCRQFAGVVHTINPLHKDVLTVLTELSWGNMVPVVIDATGSQQAINAGFNYISHGGKYVLVGLQKEEIHFDHPGFHKREATLMSSRNATRADMEQVLAVMRRNQFQLRSLITHRVGFDDVAGNFPSWLDPANGVIKAMVEID